jgi:hypothetical protein
LTFCPQDGKFKRSATCKANPIYQRIFLDVFDKRKNPAPIPASPFFEDNGKKIYVFQVPITGRR